MPLDYEAGELLLIDKPLEWTSFDVVKKIKIGLKIKKIGHAGTLDPLATGLLIICTGKKTKEIDTFQGLEKEYTGSFVLGASSPSFDLETEVTQQGNLSSISIPQIKNVTKEFIGEQQQLPPMYSAVQVNGVRLYKLARKGEQIEVKPRAIVIYEFEITHINLPNVSFRIRCSKGTYIRSIARDFGNKLGVGCYLAELRRTKIGDFDLSTALSPQEYISKNI